MKHFLTPPQKKEEGEWMTGITDSKVYTSDAFFK